MGQKQLSRKIITYTWRLGAWKQSRGNLSSKPDECGGDQQSCHPQKSGILPRVPRRLTWQRLGGGFASVLPDAALAPAVPAIM